MPNLSILSGNFSDVTNKLFPITNGAFVADEAEGSMDQILRDLHRSRFLDSNGKSFDDYIDHWTSPDVTIAYTQGIQDGSLYKLTLQYFIGGFDGKLLEKNPATGQLKRPATLLVAQQLFPNEKEVSEDDILTAYKSSFQEFSFAYFDDNGIPCALNITQTRLEPDVWTAAIIRNTTAAPKERQVLVIGSDELIGSAANKKTIASTALDSFWTFSQSHEIKKLLKGLFSKNGKLDVNEMDKISKLLEQKNTCNEEQLARIISLQQQSSKVGLWNLNNEQMEQAKSMLMQSYKNNYQGKLDSLKGQINSIDRNLEELSIISKQPFYKRDPISTITAISGLAIVIGLALILSGVLAPVGISLLGTASYLVFGAGLIAGTTALVSSIKIIGDERKLSREINKLDSTKASLISKRSALHEQYEDKCQEISKFKQGISEFKTESLIRAVVTANLSDEEFAHLEKQILTKPTTAPEPDDSKQIDPDLIEEIKEEFTQSTSNVSEAPATLLRAKKSVKAVAEEASQLSVSDKLKIQPSDDLMENQTTRSAPS